MILVEPDDDLAMCVIQFFEDRFDVVRKGTLDDVRDSIGQQGADYLLADISCLAAGDATVIGQIRREGSGAKMILTYLAPAARDSWEEAFRPFADLIVRKPYSVGELERQIATFETDSAGIEGEENGG